MTVMKKEKCGFQPPYPQEFKENLVRRMLPPESIDPKKLAIETGVSTTSLNTWLKKYKETTNENEKIHDWIPIEVDTTENIVRIEDSSLTIKVGSIGIEVKPGFDKNLLTEVLMVVSSL